MLQVITIPYVQPREGYVLLADVSVGTLFSKDVGRCVLTGGYGRRIWIKVEWRAGN